MPHKDEIPILEHEVGLNVDGEIHSNSVYVKQYGHSSNTFKLAIVTMVIFVCALLFIFLFLITPVIYSLDHPIVENKGEAVEHQHDMQMSGDHESDEHGGEHSDHKPEVHATDGPMNMDGMSHQHRKRRSISSDAIGHHSSIVCPCLKNRSTHSSSKLTECLKECGLKLTRHGSYKKSKDHARKFN